MIKKVLCLAVYLFALMSCHTSSWEKTAEGIVVHPENSDAVHQVRLAVVNETVIHVSATPDKFSEEPSLVVEKMPCTTSWQVTEEEGEVILQTPALKAYTHLKTGEVRFTDPDGKTILQENRGGGKTFTPMKADNTPGYALRQVFESPDDEAFYGLGQHQADEFNYKGKNEVLFQYNTKVSIPFFISNKNYGILWDNYSVTKFGDVRDYSPLSQFKLYDMKGAEGGLTATYYADSDTHTVFVTRVESNIDYENLETVKNFPSDFPFNNSTIVWEGDLQAKDSGVHRFLLYYAGYTKIWIDGKLMADKWRTAWNPSVAKFNVAMEAGKHHHIRLEWQPDGGIS